MEITAKNLMDSFKLGYDAYKSSKNEAKEVDDLYHNRQYTQEQLSILADRGQPPETFNVVKMYARMLVGYYSTIVNTVVASPRHYDDVDSAAALNATISKVFEQNRFDTEGDKIKLNGLLSGLFICYEDVEDTGERDSFNRPVYQVVCHHVPEDQIVLDPRSTKDNYEDGRWLHRFKWITDEAFISTFGKDKLKDVDAYSNYLGIDEAEFDYSYTTPFSGSYRIYNNYLVVHTVVVDNEGRRWSIMWSGDKILEQVEITYRHTKWHYRVQKVHDSSKIEYYGLFRDVIAPQHALNQAIIKIQLMVNSDKVLVEDNSVSDIDEFTRMYNRVNAVIPVKALKGIRIENMAATVQDQYIIIDQALNRIQKVLGINDSFLGSAMASDSGRKVKIQQNQTIMQLRYITQRIQTFYRELGWDIAGLIKQYYTANQVFNLMDPVNGNRWVELNKPMMKNVRSDYGGEPTSVPVLLPVFDVGSGKVKEDEEGNIIYAPVSERGTELSFLKMDIRIESNSYNDEDEQAQLMLETVMSGSIGQVLIQSDPAAFLETSALIIKQSRTRYAPDMARILARVAEKMDPEVAAMIRGQQVPQQSSQPKSKQLKLPQNTNEEVV